MSKWNKKKSSKSLEEFVDVFFFHSSLIQENYIYEMEKLLFSEEKQN